MAKQTKPSIVFAHGLWADGSCFQKLIPALQADGHEVMCSQHGLDSLKSDVEWVTRCFARVSGPVVLVGHSYGGTLITHAGMDDRVAALVYIAALAPDETETSQSQQQKFPVTEVFSHIEVADGRIWLKPDGIGCFAGDLPEAEQKLVWATQAVPVPDLFTQRSTASPGGPSQVGTLWLPKIAPSNPNCTASLQSAWARQPSSCAPVTSRCSLTRMLC
jgi:pimeloyl-ACP methyl ester carboxylesterase